MANRKVSLRKYVRIDGKWRYCKPAIGKNHKVRPHSVIFKGKAEEHREGNYYLHYCEGQCEAWKKVGNDAVNAAYSLDYERFVKEAEATGVNVVRVGYKPPAPQAWLANQVGHGEVESKQRFPLPHTPDDGGYRISSIAALN